MRGFQEFKGQSTRLDYNRERDEFVARPVPHPFVVCSAASEVKTEPTELEVRSVIAAPNRPRARADKVASIFARPSPKKAALDAERGRHAPRSQGQADGAAPRYWAR